VLDINASVRKSCSLLQDPDPFRLPFAEVLPSRDTVAHAATGHQVTGVVEPTPASRLDMIGGGGLGSAVETDTTISLDDLGS